MTNWNQRQSPTNSYVTDAQTILSYRFSSFENLPGFVFSLLGMAVKISSAQSCRVSNVSLPIIATVIWKTRIFDIFYPIKYFVFNIFFWMLSTFLHFQHTLTGIKRRIQGWRASNQNYRAIPEVTPFVWVKRGTISWRLGNKPKPQSYCEEDATPHKGKIFNKLDAGDEVTEVWKRCCDLVQEVSGVPFAGLTTTLLILGRLIYLHRS